MLLTALDPAPLPVPPEFRLVWWGLTAILGLAVSAIGWVAKELVKHWLDSRREIEAKAKEEQTRTDQHNRLLETVFGSDDSPGIEPRVAQVELVAAESASKLKETRDLLGLSDPEMKREAIRRKLLGTLPQPESVEDRFRGGAVGLPDLDPPARIHTAKNFPALKDSKPKTREDD